MDINIKTIIADAIKDGDWTVTGGLVTRNQLIEFLIEESKTEKYINCPVCTKTIQPRKVTFTHRSAKYLLSAIFLSDDAVRRGEDGFVHHDIIKRHAEDNWIIDRGKKKGFGIVYTSYSNLTKAPWDFLEPMVATKDKARRNGEFKPTDRCRAFLRGQLDIPEWLTFMNNEVIRYSTKNVNMLRLKNVNFHQCVELFKTFS